MSCKCCRSGPVGSRRVMAVMAAHRRCHPAPWAPFLIASPGHGVRHGVPWGEVELLGVVQRSGAARNVA